MMKIKKSTILSLALSISSLFLTTPVAARETVKETLYQNGLGSSSNSKAVTANNIRYGVASYYSDKFHGRRTASGEIFNMYKLTAASNRYKFGTMLKVTCAKTNKSVVVKVNDTGSFTKKYNREIDLSYAAAKTIGILDRGVARVKIEEIK